ncbi:M14 family zinc carboxypeptidase [Streptomyces sp. NPDC020681]|uniref:M14 family zinc carboxypeptidase n=1 Tax=Streptomyces sp. NPDC020681 TaxID=3365083 RepID=UPI0037A05CF3
MATSTTAPTATARPGSPWVSRATEVPDTDAYPGVDELLGAFRTLAATHPDLVAERRIGTSRLGEPLYCFSVGDPGAGGRGERDGHGRNFVVVGGVHPNEPVGAVTALHLATALCQDGALRETFGAVWHIVPCIDPDGARLNEGWFATPFDKRAYGRHFYRPAFDQQVEWTFPFAYKDVWFDRVMPETLALMRLLDDVRPQFLTTLHNGELGGVYYYLNRPMPELYGTLHAIPASLGIPLDTGEPEAPHIPRYAPAVYGCIDMADAYEYLDGLGVDPAAEIAGTSSAAYAERHGTLYLVTEVPHWTHPDADDEALTSETYAEVVRRRGHRLRETGDVLSRILETAGPRLTIPSPFLRAARAFIPSLVNGADAEEARAETLTDGRRATVAERYGCDASVDSFRIRFGGILLRALEAEIGAGVAAPEVRRCHRELLAVRERWEAQAEATAGRPIPISTLAGIQYAAILATAATTIESEGAPAADRTSPAPAADNAGGQEPQ